MTYDVKSISVRLPPEIYTDIKEIADEQYRSINSVIIEACHKYVLEENAKSIKVSPELKAIMKAPFNDQELMKELSKAYDDE